MERAEITEKVIACVKDSLGLADDAELTEATTLKDLGADSFDQLEIMVALEDALDGGDSKSVDTIGQAVDLVQAQL